MYRQGDVLLVSIDRFPETAQPVESRVVALGEATGHAHRLTGGARQLVDPRNGAQYVEILEEGGQLVHDEHATLAFCGPARYAVILQTEFQPEVRSRPEDGSLLQHLDWLTTQRKPVPD